ncbi:MAG TPA: transketolase [Thermoanaerobaculia bacterium]|nr:transketolase [Thermoanaerobaculia bacterium]
MSPSAATDLTETTINTIRFLAVDMVQKANSGHPGTPMAQAPLAYQLWSRHLRFNPKDPDWPNRDRFVLSCGHASALLYSLLHLSGYDLPKSELERFRQLHSQTPGHPEYGLTPGVETTTGPLGQGISTAVGMALAQRLLANRFNRPELPLLDYRIWVIASDGDLMEGISSEASSLAAHQKLDRLTVFYDDNHITIDGPTTLAFSEDVGKRYEAYGWHVQHVADANDLEAIDEAIVNAKNETERPSLVVFRSHIGFGSPHKQDTASAHGSPLGAEEVELTKRNLGWPVEPTFLIPEEAYRPFREAAEHGAQEEERWQAMLERYRQAEPELAAELERRWSQALPKGWESHLPSFTPGDGPMATRSASGKVLNAICDSLPELVGGSADLTPSNDTYLNERGNIEAGDPGGRNFHFGIREHAMGAVLSGLALAKAFIPYGGTFLIFSDYMRPAVRLAALMKLPAIYVYTHDSIFLGEDGPTHQPVSQLLSLRSIPNLTVLRPADANETAAAWRVALTQRDRGPVALVLTRQKLPVLEGTAKLAQEGVERGAYVLSDEGESEPRVVLIATGSEVSLAIAAQRLLAADGIATRVVSMPSQELFLAQSPEYQRQVLPQSLDQRVAIEAAIPLGWERFVGRQGLIIGVTRFGASAPYKELAEEFGFTPEKVVEKIKELLAGRQ